MDAEIRDYQTSPTDYLPHVVNRCVDKANQLGCRFRFTLNGATALVSPGQSAASVLEDVQRQWDAAARRPDAAGVAGAAPPG